jgi:hypothetical protein
MLILCLGNYTLWMQAVLPPFQSTVLIAHLNVMLNRSVLLIGNVKDICVQYTSVFFFNADMPLPSMGCYLSLQQLMPLAPWHTVPLYCRTEYCRAGGIISYYAAMQPCVHCEAVHPVLYTDTKLPTFNKYYFLLFPVQIQSCVAHHVDTT